MGVGGDKPLPHPSSLASHPMGMGQGDDPQTRGDMEEGNAYLSGMITALEKSRSLNGTPVAWKNTHNDPADVSFQAMTSEALAEHVKLDQHALGHMLPSLLVGSEDPGGAGDVLR